jgi:8-hydroxy-5-deazaflavin:NADPH oxidoreductase
MKIAVIGRGNVGGGLARLWRKAGHDVTEIGKDGGSASDVEAVLLAVPSGVIADALGKVEGLEGKVAIDATNHFQGERPPFDSLAHQVKSITGGPVSKAFNLNFAAIYDELDKQPIRPSNLYCGDDEAREVTEQLIRDAGYEPVSAGGLENARTLEESLALLMAITGAGGGQVFYRVWRPGQLEL